MMGDRRLMADRVLSFMEAPDRVDRDRAFVRRPPPPHDFFGTVI